MREFHINDEPSYSDLDTENISLLVTNYEYFGYEGDGSALALYHDGSVKLFSLGHCSCYEPFERSDSGSWKSVEDFKNCAASEVGDTVLESKFIELL